MLPESKTPDASDEAVWAIESLFVQVTVVPLVMVSGLGTKALEPSVLAPEGIVTGVPEPPLDPVVGPEGDELPQPVNNPTNTILTATRHIITASIFCRRGNSRAARRLPEIHTLFRGRVTAAGRVYHQRNCVDNWYVDIFTNHRVVQMRAIGIGVALAVICAALATHAQVTAPKPSPKVPAKPTGTLAQVMRGIYFPNANLIFDVQQNDPGAPKKKPAEAGGSATKAYGSAYTGWEIVENAAIALTDGVDLILTPGRSCQNGKPVPYRQADFQKFAGDMRKAGLAVLQAAHMKSQEKVSDATNDLADACSNCHEVYRDKGPADSPARCSPAVTK